MPDSTPKIRPKIRLYVNAPYQAGQALVLDAGQSHYLSHVMRCQPGDPVAIFNGTDGVWEAIITHISKKQVMVELNTQIHPQQTGPDIWLAFAPIKNKTELVVEKAVELGAGRLMPVFMQHSVVRSIKHDKLLAHAVEAAEQCERHDVPPLEEYRDIAALLAAWPANRPLLYADESGGGRDLKSVLSNLPDKACGVLVGPEGGFSSAERQLLHHTSFVLPFGMGPRILRADTAAVAALACVSLWLGDWNQKPHFEAAS